MPVIAHLEGLCHTYVDGAADPEKARAIVLNAKMRRGVDLRRDRDAAGRPRRRRTMLPPILADLRAAGCEIRGDAAVPRGRSRHACRRPKRIGDRISRRDPRGARRRRRRRRDRAHQPLRLAPHRRDRHRGQGGRRALSRRGRQRHRAGQRLDPVRRWRRVRHGRRDRHLDRSACRRAGRSAPPS